MKHAASRPAMESYEPVFVARQPIFTPELRVWGYELLFRDGRQAPAAAIVDGDVATARVIADGYALVHEGVHSSRKLLVNFPRARCSMAPRTPCPAIAWWSRSSRRSSRSPTSSTHVGT